MTGTMTETTWIGVNTETIEWLDAIAEHSDMTTEEVVDQLLRHGAVHHEDILRFYR